MYVKSNTVIPAGFKITRCPPGQASGRSIYQLEREQEERLAAEAEQAATAGSMKASDRTDRENEYGAGIKAGLSVEQSIGENDR